MDLSDCAKCAADAVSFALQLVFYDATTVPGAEPTMHSEGVASLAVGKTLGVAPDARLYFFATPTWKVDNSYYAQAMEKVISLNERLPRNEQIRAVSISFGGFRDAKNYLLWQKALNKAQEQGIIVCTCDPTTFLSYLILDVDFNKDSDQPESWPPTAWQKHMPENSERVCVPAGNRTAATPRGIDSYESFRNAGWSWGAPYIAGLAALVLQVRPDLSPVQIKKLMLETATPVSFGKIINPKELISEARNLPR